MLRNIRNFYLNTEFIETIHSIDETSYELHMVSGAKHVVSKEMGDKLILELKAKDAKKAADKGFPHKTAKDLNEVLQMTKKVFNR